MATEPSTLLTYEDLVNMRGATGSYEKVAEISVETGGVLTTPLLPRLAIDINLVFAP